MAKDSMVKMFCDLVSIPSPSGREKRVVTYLQKHLNSMGVHNYIDSSAKQTKGEVGNLIAKIGSGRPTLLFVAHMDTVEDGKRPIIPVLKNGTIKPKERTVLGADDKSGCTSMIHAIKNLNGEKNIPATIFVFSTNEEGGKAGMGVEYIDIKDRVDYAFSIDGSNRAGIFFNKALGTRVFEVSIKGRAAHAESVPHKGANAVKAAGLIVAKLQIGKSKSDGSMLNVGMMSGGGTTTAVVPDNAKLVGEFGAFNYKKMNQLQKHIEKTVKDGCKKTGCTFKTKFYTEETAPPFSKSANDKQISLAKKAASAAGLEFSLMTLNATSEVNVLAGMGYNTLAMTRGGRNAHSVKEQLKVSEMEDTARLITEIIRQAKHFAR